jgi:hypothetical protein
MKTRFGLSLSFILCIRRAGPFAGSFENVLLGVVFPAEEYDVGPMLASISQVVVSLATVRASRDNAPFLIRVGITRINPRIKLLLRNLAWYLTFRREA